MSKLLERIFSLNGNNTRDILWMSYKICIVLLQFHDAFKMIGNFKFKFFRFWMNEWMYFSLYCIFKTVFSTVTRWVMHSYVYVLNQKKKKHSLNWKPIFDGNGRFSILFINAVLFSNEFCELVWFLIWFVSAIIQLLTDIFQNT